MDTQASQKSTIVVILLAVLIVAAFLVYGYVVGFKRPTPSPAPKSQPAAQTSPAAPTAVATSSLGDELYKKVSNPVSGKLPSTVAPVPNPVEGLYKNPFQ